MTLKDNVNAEKSNVDELRRRMKGLMTPELFKEDNVFERFLRARNQNLDAAEAMLNNHIKWREINKIDTIKTDFTPSEVLQKYSSLESLGFDKDGSVVIYCCFGGMDTRGIYKSGKRTDFMHYFIQVLEENLVAMKENSEKTGKPIHQWVMIFDYENFQLSNATHKGTIEILINMIHMYDANYPERLKAAYLVNGSIVFQICWAIIRPFLSGPTIQKIKIFGKDSFQEELLKNIDADVLPAFLGGNRTDPDGNPKCLQSIRFGGVIPECYYVENSNRRLSLLPDSKQLVVNRHSKAEVELEVVHPGSTIEWEFILKSKDVDFSVVFRDHREIQMEGKEEVVMKQRVEAGLCTDSGMYRCEKAGIYSLVFDNSYSWLHSKHICYAVSVAKP